MRSWLIDAVVVGQPLSCVDTGMLSVDVPVSTYVYFLFLSHCEDMVSKEKVHIQHGIFK